MSEGRHETEPEIETYGIEAVIFGIEQERTRRQASGTVHGQPGHGFPEATTAVFGVNGDPANFPAVAGSVVDSSSSGRLPRLGEKDLRSRHDEGGLQLQSCLIPRTQFATCAEQFGPG
jgi:hypothetical protein